MITHQLHMKSGPTPGKIVQLTLPEISIGRELSNDIVISDADVSRRHARLIQQGNSYLIEDVGSTNGTYVNGMRLTAPQVLTTDDRIRLGETIEIVFERPGFDAQITKLESRAEAWASGKPTENPEQVAVKVAEMPAAPRPQQFPGFQAAQPPVKVVDSGVPAPMPPYLSAAPEAVTQKKKSKTGLIIGVSALVLLCLCVVAGLLIYYFVIPALR